MDTPISEHLKGLFTPEQLAELEKMRAVMIKHPREIERERPADTTETA